MEDKILIAYFSASGTTELMAKKIADISGADIFKIEPEIPYTLEDLDWRNENSRACLENNNPSTRPKIKNRVENFQSYNLILLGFPIWWHKAPLIINTFLESYNFTNKKIICFMTDEGSVNLEVLENLKESLPKNIEIKEGQLQHKPIDEESLREWLEKINLIK